MTNESEQFHLSISIPYGHVELGYRASVKVLRNKQFLSSTVGRTACLLFILTLLTTEAIGGAYENLEHVQQINDAASSQDESLGKQTKLFKFNDVEVIKF